MLFASKTDVGQVRSSNQDYVFAASESIGPLSNLFVIADGMGGHKAGEYASSKAVQHAVSTIESSALKEPVAVLDQAISSANSVIYEMAASDDSKRGMGTTFVAATICGQHLYVANVGDSRLYLVDHSGLCQVTRDHSLVEEMRRSGEMTRDEAMHNPNKNIITRAVGVEAEVHPDYFDLFLQPREQILMCTDGLTNMVPDEEILRIMNTEPEPEMRAERLLELANFNGGKDNISVIVIDPLVDAERM